MQPAKKYQGKRFCFLLTPRYIFYSMGFKIKISALIAMAVLQTGSFCKAPDIIVPFMPGCDTVAGSILPKGWSVVRGKGTTYSFNDVIPDALHAVSRSGNTMIGIKLPASLNDYSYICWKWKAIKLPESGAENDKKKNDCVCGIYVMLKTGIFPKAIKYVWSATLPVGTIITSSLNSNLKVIILESGKEKCGQWVCERVNIKKDIARCYGEKEQIPNILGIGLMTDADNTRSITESCYGQIKIVSDTANYDASQASK
jgi:hypothetical protein